MFGNKNPFSFLCLNLDTLVELSIKLRSQQSKGGIKKMIQAQKVVPNLLLYLEITITKIHHITHLDQAT
jgi:hypothetical protein